MLWPLEKSASINCKDSLCKSAANDTKIGSVTDSTDTAFTTAMIIGARTIFKLHSVANDQVTKHF